MERSVPTVRDDCFGGEVLFDLDDARERARTWCLEEYGRRRHSRTQQAPRTHFERDEQPRLLPVPSAAYDVPLWSTPKVAHDQLAQVARALYSIPHAHVGRRLTARADSQLVRFYDRGVLIKTHARQPPGGRAIDPHDYPVERSVYALRNVQALQVQADAHGAGVARFAVTLLDGPLPWTRMRRVYALLGLVRRLGAGRVNEACVLALALDMLDVRRLERMLALGHATPPPAPTRRVLPRPRYLRSRAAVRAAARHPVLQRRDRMTTDTISPDLRTTLLGRLLGSRKRSTCISIAPAARASGTTSCACCSPPRPTC